MVVRSILKSAWRTAARHRAGGVRAALSATGSPMAEGVATALDGALRGAMDDNERAWERRIEAERLELSRSTRTITVSDHGAGSKRDGRSPAAPPGATRTITIAQACQASKPPFWGRLLFRLVRAVRPSVVLELGTCVGVSAAYQAAALELNGSGQLVTLEGAEALADVARQTIAQLRLGNATVITGRFQDTLDGVLESNRPIDYAFIDGHHAEQATIEYFEQIAPHLAPSALLVFDDISWSAGMRRAWETIAASERVGIALDLRSVGVCVIDPEVRTRARLRLPLV